MFTQLHVSALRRASMVAMAAAMIFSAQAATTVIDGITYTVPKANATTIEVAKDASYSGDIVIPDKVTYDGKEYAVASIAATAFKGNANVTSITINATQMTKFGRGQFSNMTGLTSIVLPPNLSDLTQDTFSGCEALKEISFPGKVKALKTNDIQNCLALEKITFEAGEGEVTVPVGIWGGTKANERVLKELVLERVVSTPDVTGPALLPWTNSPLLEKVVFGEAWKEIPAYYLQGCKQLADVTLPSGLTSLGSQSLLGTAITEITIPDGVTAIQTSTFNGCKKLTKVTLGSGVTSIGDLAFSGSGLTEINFPAGLTSIGAYAFSGTKLAGDIVIPDAVTTIGAQAFADNKAITSMGLPASLKSIGSSAFKGCFGITAFTLGENAKFAVQANGALTTADGAKILAYPAAAAATEFTDNATEIDNYAFFGAKNLATINLPNCATYGDFSLAETGITAISLNGTIGRSVLANCVNLKEATVAGQEVPIAICSGCTALETYNNSGKVTIVRQEAFKGCTALKNINLGNIVVIIEADAFAGVEGLNITLGSNTPPSLALGVFPEGAPISATVPVDLVNAYKAAPQWSNLTINGDESIAIGGQNITMPYGLYYSGDDDQLHCVYADGNTDDYQIDMPHTFQLTQFKNRIYGASAGKKFVYSGTAATEGDGKLFYISRVDNNLFQATVLDNAGNNAYLDPFALYIYGDNLFVNDRNVALRKIPAEAIALPQNYESFAENNWFDAYGKDIVYGCIKAGFSITQDQDESDNPEPLFWIGFKYNGNGIMRFKEKHIGTAEAPGPETGMAHIFKGVSPVFTTFYIDEPHRHLYIYHEREQANFKKEGALKAGVYRFNLDDIIENPDPAMLKDLNPILIDGSPVKFEGAGAQEHVGIQQFSVDETGTYLYWAHRAATAADIENVQKDLDNDAATRYPWAEEYDETNPLHQSGIKRIKLGEEKPEVEMVVPGVTGYGVVPVQFEGSKKPDGINQIIAPAKTKNDRVVVKGNQITLLDAAQVNVYAANGQLITANVAAANATQTLSGKGVYMVEANFIDGSKQVVKVVVK